MAEDNDSDYLLSITALEDAKINFEIKRAIDGLETIEYLSEENLRIFKPDIIILDLRMPKKNGFEVLKEIKNDIKLIVIPTIIFSTSDSDGDIDKSYKTGANSFITKPNDYSDLVKLVKIIYDYWFENVKRSNIL
jgi:CheY-like chemotaxis protein